MLKKIFIIFFCLVISNIGYAYTITANQIMDLCNSSESANAEECNMYFAGYLDGIISGTTIVDWNLPNGQDLSVETIKNSFIKILHDYPIMGDHPANTVTTFALVQQGALKEKNKN